jgi:hypothetical protein
MPVDVGERFNFLAEFERDVLRVAAAQIEFVEARQDAEIFDSHFQPFVPAPRANFFESAVAELLFVCLAMAKGNVREL